MYYFEICLIIYVGDPDTHVFRIFAFYYADPGHWKKLKWLGLCLFLGQVLVMSSMCKFTLKSACWSSLDSVHFTDFTWYLALLETGTGYPFRYWLSFSVSWIRNDLFWSGSSFEFSEFRIQAKVLDPISKLYKNTP